MGPVVTTVILIPKPDSYDTERIQALKVSTHNMEFNIISQTLNFDLTLLRRKFLVIKVENLHNYPVILTKLITKTKRRLSNGQVSGQM